MGRPSKLPWREVLIIGGTGKMGQWFSRFFREQGFNVTITSRKPSRALRVARKLKVKLTRLSREALASSDLVLLSIPPSETAEIIEDIASKMRKNTVLIEISSVKTNLASLLEEIAVKFGIKVVSLHPMFGPSAKSIHGYSIIVVPVKGCEKAAKKVAKFFREAGAKVVFAKNFAEHEEMTALTLALPHFINLLFGLTLSLTAYPIRKISDYGGTTFILQKILCESVISEDPKLYGEIQIANRRFKEAVLKLSQAFSKLKQTVEENDLEEFTRIFGELQKYFSGDPKFGRAYELFYEALEAVKQP